jgi:cytochrome bd-type quinol oxidase subunit 2
MMNIIYVLASVILVSLISLIGIVFFWINEKKLDQLLLVLVSLSAGSLFGGAFLHLLPEVIEEEGALTITISFSRGVSSGIMLLPSSPKIRILPIVP